MATTIATWLYAEREGEESVYPQVGGRPSSSWFQAVYWRCVVIFFASSVRTAPQASRVLWTNAEVPDVDGHDIGSFLNALGVEVATRPFTFQPPRGYYSAWQNQFYVLDLIEALSERLGPDDTGVLLDSDCIWTQAPDRLVGAVQRHRALTFDVGLAEDEWQNGLTRRDMGALYAELGSPAAGIPPYIGGELVAITGAMAAELAKEARAVWETMIERFARGESTFKEEAHLLSFLYHRLGVEPGTANPFIDRIYTSLKDGKTVRPEHLDLMLWHLPNEKRYGLRRLFPAVMDRSSWFWTLPVGDAWRARVGKVVGVPRRTPRKAILDVSAAVRDKLRRH